MDDQERPRRWRLILGGGEADGTGVELDPAELGMDRALSALYEGQRSGGLGSSTPAVVRWLEDIRTYFPRSVVQLLQSDAIERLDLKRMLLEPELLESVEPDVHLVSTLMALGSVMPQRTKETARIVVRKVVEQLEQRLRQPLEQAVRGALNRATRNRKPRHGEIDWNRTIRANLKHWQVDRKALVPETLVGFGHKRSALRDVILCVDQSGSMAASVVYAGVFGCVLARLAALKTSLVVFDTAVVDLSETLSDPVELLLGTQLGGGTDIAQALSYSQSLVRRPADTILILISDLFEGGNRDEMLRRASVLVASGVQVIALLALNDAGAPSFDAAMAAGLAALGIPAFACAPDQFPELMGAALRREDLALWAAAQGIVASREHGE